MEKHHLGKTFLKVMFKIQDVSRVAAEYFWPFFEKFYFFFRLYLPERV